MITRACHLILVTALLIGTFQGRSCLAGTGIPGLKQISSQFHPSLSAGSRPIKVAFFDADSTIRISSSQATHPLSPDDVVILPEVAEHIRELNREGYLVAIVSNQGQVGRGQESFERVDQTMSRTVELLEKQGARVDYYDFAPRLDHNRKPETGMAETLEKKLKELFGPKTVIDRQDSFMVGDAAYAAPAGERPGDPTPEGGIGTHFSNSDRLFAENYGISFKESSVFFGWRPYGIDVMRTPGDIKEYLERSRCDRLLRAPYTRQASDIHATSPEISEESEKPNVTVYRSGEET